MPHLALTIWSNTTTAKVIFYDSSPVFFSHYRGTSVSHTKEGLLMNGTLLIKEDGSFVYENRAFPNIHIFGKPGAQYIRWPNFEKEILMTTSHQTAIQSLVEPSPLKPPQY